MLSLLPQVLTSLTFGVTEIKIRDPGHPSESPVWEHWAKPWCAQSWDAHLSSMGPQDPLHPFSSPFSGGVLGFEMPGETPQCRMSADSVFLALSPGLL